MRTIPLTQGKVATIDDADYPAVSVFKWHAKKQKLRNGRSFYAARNTVGPSGRRTLRLHTFLMPDAEEIDHKDGNGLNNQRNNLRPATPLQNNQAFASPRPNKSSRFRGVDFHATNRVWQARITVNKKTKYLGCFESETEAARAYDKAAREFFGEFAAPNFS